MASIKLSHPHVSRVIASICLGIVLAVSYRGHALIDGFLYGAPMEASLGIKTFALALILSFVCYIFLAIMLSEKFQEIGKRAADRVFRVRKKNVILIAIVLCICWLPVIVAMYPFFIGPDTVAQLLWTEGFQAFDPSSRQSLASGFVISDHHPVFDALIYGLFYKFGSLLGNAAWGLTLLCWIQTVIGAIVFSYACCWMRRNNVPAFLCFGAFVFWALNPVFPMLFQQLVKDTTSMPFFILWVLGFADLVVAVWKSKRITTSKVMAIVTLTCLCALMRKTLLYITVPSLAVLLVVVLIFRMKKGSQGDMPLYKVTLRQVLLMCLVPTLIIVIVLPKVIFPLFLVAPGGTQEMLAVPIQQVARVVVDKSDEISSEDRAIIGAVLPYNDIVLKYDANIADPVKDMWNRDASMSDTIAFLAKWVELGVRYPAQYLKAAPYLFDFWCVGMYDSDTPVVWWGWEEKGSSELLPEYPSGYQTDGQRVLDHVVRGEFWGNSQVLKLFFDVAFYLLWIPVFAIALTMFRRKKNVLLFLPVILSIAVVLIVPAAQPRYAFNLVFLCPIIFSLAYIGPKELPCSAVPTQAESVSV